MYYDNNWAVVVPMANEEKDFSVFINELIIVLNKLNGGTVYLIIDNVSKDKTFELCSELSDRDSRFKTIWAPENKNVVDAYMRGYKEAFVHGHDLIIEMDAGMSHDPKALPHFLEKLNAGFECVFGSRFIKGGSISTSFFRYFLSKGGTIISNFLLGTNMSDMTSGYQGFQRHIVEKFLNYPLRSKAHFYQTELRYLLRNQKYVEIPVHYKSPSNSVSGGSVSNSLMLIMKYWVERVRNKEHLI